MTEGIMSTSQAAQDLALVSANIVILAEAHSPKILSTEWLRENCGVDEEPIHVINTPELSLFDAEGLQIVSDQARLQLIDKRLQEDSLEKLGKVASKYIQVLPHISYVAVGINFIWQLDTSKSSHTSSFNLYVGEKKIPAKVDLYDVDFGGIVYGNAPDHRMKLIIERLPPNVISYNINFHFDVKSEGLEKAIQASLSTGERILTAQKIIQECLLLEDGV